MALFLYLAGAVVEAIETAPEGVSEREGEDEAISRHHEHRMFHGLDRAGATEGGCVG